MAKNALRAFGVALLLSACATSSVSAQSTKERVRLLEQEMITLQARLQSEASGVRLDQLSRQVQELTGQVEELSFKLNAANERLNAVSSILANDPALSDAFAASGLAAGLQGSGDEPARSPSGGEGGSATGGPTALTPGDDPIGDRIADATGASATPPAADVKLPSDPIAAFEYASGFLLRGDYERARSAFERYLENFPTGSRIADAQFRLGEIYLATGANAEAADAFIAHIRKFPNDPRAAEAYLKLGTAFVRMSQATEACRVLSTLKSKFPNASPAILQRTELEMRRASCS
ncbi:MAG: tol-pal system protein YbgF [Pseudomonadota bacterium]